MTVHVATALAGLTANVQKSVNSVFRGDILLANGSVRRGFIKDLDPRQFGNELLVAALAERLNVTVPEVAIVRIPSGISSAFQMIPASNGDGHIAFCSIDAEGSTVAQIINSGGDEAATYEEIRKNPGLGRMYGLDTWVANTDRHRNNLILRGDGKVFLIDHGHCFSGPSWTPSDLIAGDEYVNRLRHWLTPRLSRDDKDHAMADINALVASMMGEDVQTIINDCFASHMYGANDSDAIVGFLENRVAHVVQLSAKSLETI